LFISHYIAGVTLQKETLRVKVKVRVTVKVNLKFTLEQAMKAQWEGEV
jgi:hypothetical protein